MESPKVQKVGHWLSKYIYIVNQIIISIETMEENILTNNQKISTGKLT